MKERYLKLIEETWAQAILVFCPGGYTEQQDLGVRVFVDSFGIPEDPVTGSAYTQLAPYWASKLGSKKFSVKQMSSRGGELTCEVAGDRVFITGRAIKYLEGKIEI